MTDPIRVGGMSAGVAIIPGLGSQTVVGGKALEKKTIELFFLSDILKISIFEAMQIQFDCVFICRYPMLAR